MTGQELKDHICLLGARTTDEFEEEFQNELIYSAINRAIGEVNKLFPVTKTVQLLNYPRRPADYHKLTVHKGGEDIVFNASDIKSLAFAVSGTGRAILSGEGSVKPHTFKWQDAVSFKTIRAIVAQALSEYKGGEVTLTFTGETSYMIADLSLYSELDSDLVEDVEVWSPWVCYDMKSSKYLGESFLDFASLPVRSHDVRLNAPSDYRIEESCIYLPAQKTGVYEIKYYERPVEVDADNLDAELNIDFRLHELAALRAAYYIYAVLDEEVAAQCNNEYKTLYGVVLSTLPKIKTPRRFRDERGW